MTPDLYDYGSGGRRARRPRSEDGTKEGIG